LRGGAIEFELADDRLDADTDGGPDTERGRDAVFDPEVTRQTGVTGPAIGLPERCFVGAGQVTFVPESSLRKALWAPGSVLTKEARMAWAAIAAALPEGSAKSVRTRA
jgi:hypothetical protein